MLIWSGWGIIVFVIVFASSLIMEILVRGITGDSTYYQLHNWPLTLSLVLSGVACWFLGQHLNKPIERTLIDKETGEEIKLTNAKHKLFFIKMEYWGPILVIIGILNLIS